uniref:Uncharacterized protein n=1 Tax=Arundo donax TaxID=35708 RepID=A0A0A9A2I7_ARUDO
MRHHKWSPIHHLSRFHTNCNKSFFTFEVSLFTMNVPGLVDCIL